jgi:pilus assembly protein CpaB
LLLAIGFLALAAGIVLSVLSLRAPRQPAVATAPAAPKQVVLTAAHDLPAATLLRSDDIKWVEIAGSQVPPGSFVRGAATGEPDVLGAATSRALKAGDPVAADVIIRPTEAGFMPAVLTPGMRAISLQIDAAGVGAGLIQPNDRVDVLLTQNLHEAGGNAAFRSVGETILRNLRVIAVDQTHMQAVDQERKTTVTAPPRVPQIVTLEVTTQQAEKLTVAHELGRLQLTLRGLTESAGAGAAVPPTWATDVSQALRYISGSDSGTPGEGKDQSADATSGSAAPGAPPPNAAPLAVDIFRGTKTEHRCFSEKAAAMVECKPGAVAPAAGPAGDIGGAPAAAVPGKASALAVPQTALPT